MVSCARFNSNGFYLFVSKTCKLLIEGSRGTRNTRRVVLDQVLPGYEFAGNRKIYLVKLSAQVFAIKKHGLRVAPSGRTE